MYTNCNRCQVFGAKQIYTKWSVTVDIHTERCYNTRDGGEMKINWRILRVILPDLAHRGITGSYNVFHGASLIGKYYCEPLSMVGLCPEVCQECAAHLDHMTKDINRENWYKDLIWHAKDERAIVKDLHSVHEAREVSENIFADFADRLQ